MVSPSSGRLTLSLVLLLLLAACASHQSYRFTTDNLTTSSYATVSDFLTGKGLAHFETAFDGTRVARISGESNYAQIYVDQNLYGYYVTEEMERHGVDREFIPDASVLTGIPVDSMKNIDVLRNPPNDQRLGLRRVAVDFLQESAWTHTRCRRRLRTGRRPVGEAPPRTSAAERLPLAVHRQHAARDAPC